MNEKKKKIALHKKVCKNKDFCNAMMSSEDSQIFGFNQHQKFDITPFIIYADLES